MLSLPVRFNFAIPIQNQSRQSCGTPTRVGRLGLRFKGRESLKIRQISTISTRRNTAFQYRARAEKPIEDQNKHPCGAPTKVGDLE